MHNFKEMNLNCYFFQKAFYTANFFYRDGLWRRSVFTWQHAPDNEQFIWNIKCRDSTWIP